MSVKPDKEILNEGESAPIEPGTDFIRDEVNSFPVVVDLKDQDYRIDQASDDTFGHASVTKMWSEALIYSLQDHKWVSSSRLVIHRVERTEHNRGYRITVSLSDCYGAHWLQLDDGSSIFGVVLPSEYVQRGRQTFDVQTGFVIEFVIDDSVPNTRPRVLRLHVRLSTDNIRIDHNDSIEDVRRNLRSIANVWEQAKRGKYGTFVRPLWALPLGSTVFALTLLRFEPHSILAYRDYFTDLCKSWPDFPDLRVVSNQIILSTLTEGHLPAEIGNSLVEMNGLPFTAEGLGYAAKQTELVLEALEARATDFTQSAALKDLNFRMQTALRVFRPSGGLFSGFSGTPNEIGPALIESNYPLDQEVT
jgi:hypothetical protein